MKKEIKELSELISKSKSILIVSHQGPDPDAMSCTAFTLNILRFNFPDKTINANLDSAKMDDFAEVLNVNDISTLDWLEAIEKYNPELLICCDFGEYKLISSNYNQEAFFKRLDKGLKVVMIDHHPKVEQRRDVYINNFDSSCVETIYEVLVKEIGLKKYPKYQNHVLFGIIGDTGSFAWADKNTDHCFDTAKELVNDGGEIDKIQEAMNKKTLGTVKIHAEYLKNLQTNGEYTYSFISDNFKVEHPEVSEAEFTAANKQFVYSYLRSVEGAKWGFTVKPKGKSGDYSISFRAQVGIIDVSKIASHLNGNGHKGSSGGLIQAKSSEDAVKMVINAIEKYKEEAYANK